ncbi:MAG: amino acid ABC transporter permease [Deltaproteobacteria bacterium]|jgi:polar amino acid transport system permease protein|nr:amino acid ABC transporter permease [Deltaproteobacteria bacterium]
MISTVYQFCKRSHLLDIAAYLALLFGCIFILFKGAEDQGYYWQWYRIPKYLYVFEDGRFITGPILEGLKVTLDITWISLILTYVIGLVTALMRLSNSLLAKAVARTYLEIARNTPLLVQIFFMYFVIAPILDIDRFAAAVLALSFFEGSYASEIYRAGIVSIDRGQWEAAHSLGMNVYQGYRYIILPQAIRRILPPLTSQAVSLIKDSSLVSVIAVYEMTMCANEIASETFLVFEVFFTIAAIYLTLALILSRVVAYFEKH